MTNRLNQGGLIAAIFLLAACVPQAAPSVNDKVGKARLLPSYEFVSEVNVIESHPDSGLSDQVFRLVGKRLKEKTEMQLKKQGRWKTEQGRVLHLEIERIRLRKTTAVLLLWAVSGNDEIRVKVWVTRDGEVVASDSVVTQLDNGGLFQTWAAARRLELLADQIARKIVRTRL